MKTGHSAWSMGHRVKRFEMKEIQCFALGAGPLAIGNCECLDQKHTLKPGGIRYGHFIACYSAV